jgi:hypothetical protein
VVGGAFRYQFLRCLLAGIADSNAARERQHGLLTFVVGDVHGCFDKLQALFQFCDKARAGKPARYVLVGDYTDRGPDSRKVVDLLMHKQLSEVGQFICLRGNHEQMLIVAAARGRSDRFDKVVGQRWGAET